MHFCDNEVGNPCRWCGQDRIDLFNTDGKHKPLCICKTCQEYNCAFCGKCFMIVVDETFRRGMQTRPPDLACADKNCQRRRRADHKKCCSKNCPDKDSMPINPWMLNEKGETFFEKQYDGSRDFKRSCRKCAQTRGKKS